MKEGVVRLDAYATRMKHARLPVLGGRVSGTKLVTRAP